ncbi:nuclear pore complex protein NUP96 isoform X2 [Rhodamnia argentea]|uniref:Nuclear pore complex protein NUP96 isoform X2 n=1 Tax=Rhodamnia argentea TaxID=178133 RepID=A0ABM3GZJ6_9MYRT|nr:nuclear pore complex protein NUP96 isoform X2 [Rhodamnia argentea]
MASTSLLTSPDELCFTRHGFSTASTCGVYSDAGPSDSDFSIKLKKRRISCCRREIPLPIVEFSDYFIEPCLEELATREFEDPGYLSRVQNFTVGRFGYGFVKFLGETDVRGLDINELVKFGRHELVVYGDESLKPSVGQGLNKAAEVTLVLQIGSFDEGLLDDMVTRLRRSTERQGASFISFNSTYREWKFSVQHFSRFGLSEDDEEDSIMDDAPAVQDPATENVGEISDVDEEPRVNPVGPDLSHSLPAHLGLDPAKMNEMRMLMFPNDEEELEHINEIPPSGKSSLSKDYARSSFQSSTQRMTPKVTPPVARRTPLPLLEYRPHTADSSSPGAILLTQQNRDMSLKATGVEGFKLDITCETPLTGHYSRNIVDAGLFMGRSFRVGWGPNGVLVHSGTSVGSKDSQRVLSSVINIEKVAIDKAVRDEDNKVRKELVELAFNSALNLHEALNHKTKEVEVGSFKLKLQNLVCDRLTLSGVCRSYIDIVERQLEVSGLSPSAKVILMHQVMVWELIKVLFSERENNGQSKSVGADNEEDVMEDIKDGSPDVDPEALPLIRRAEFSYWLQECVCHRVQAEISSISESSYLEHLFLLLTGRQRDAAVELAASKGDVRLACLISQAGGSPLNRSDISRQLDLWRTNGLDFSFIEKDRVRILELLAGNIGGALRDIGIDWKRFLGLLMWYQLPPDSSLPIVFQTYKQLLNNGRAPYPVPVYIDEGVAGESVTQTNEERFDFSYYLMLLHCNQDREFGLLKRMFSTLSSTNDPLDYHMIWHQRALLQAVGAFSANDLFVLDMGLVSQLLSLNQCHWAIYVVLHLPYKEDYPYLQATVIREILFQYCEIWSSEKSQQQYIEKLGVPLAWLHEAMAVYFNYHGDFLKSLEHFLQCSNWPRAHSIFVTSVAHSLFLSAKNSEIWRLASLMEEHKSEIENWDLGAGIYISFYSIKSALLEDDDSMNGLDSLESKNAACKNFLDQLNESLVVWAGRLPLEARVAYSKMAEEISSLLLSDISEDPTRDLQLSCFRNVCSAPVPEDLRASHLQDAVALYTCYLSELAS